MSADDLAEASERATPGLLGTFGMTLLASPTGGGDYDAATLVAQGLTVDDRGRPRTFDIDFIAALWNGYRTGTLISAATVREALEEVGLPETATVRDLIEHHRANAALAAGVDALSAQVAASGVVVPAAEVREVAGTANNLRLMLRSHLAAPSSTTEASLQGMLDALDAALARLTGDGG